MSGGEEAVLNISKTTKVEALRLMVEEACGVEAPRQRLFFHGKQVALQSGFFSLNKIFDFCMSWMLILYLGSSIFGATRGELK